MSTTGHGQAIQDRGRLAGSFVSQKEPSLLSHHGPFDACFRPIVINGNGSVLQESCERFPPFPEVVDSLEEK